MSCLSLKLMDITNDNEHEGIARTERVAMIRRIAFHYGDIKKLFFSSLLRDYGVHATIFFRILFMMVMIWSDSFSEFSLHSICLFWTD